MDSTVSVDSLRLERNKSSQNWTLCPIWYVLPCQGVFHRRHDLFLCANESQSVEQKGFGGSNLPRRTSKGALHRCSKACSREAETRIEGTNVKVNWKVTLLTCNCSGVVVRGISSWAGRGSSALGAVAFQSFALLPEAVEEQLTLFCPLRRRRLHAA